MDDQFKINEIMTECAELVPLLKTTGIPQIFTIRRAQFLLDWIKAGNEEQRRILGIEVGGAYYNETIEIEGNAARNR